jgi:uncharacterized protein (TIGR01244 family)
VEHTIQMGDDYVIAKFEPARETFNRMAAEGFRSVVSVQTEHEEQKLRIEDERRAAEAVGLAFYHQPVSGDTLDDEVVDRFREAIGRLPRPILLHCTSGKRSGAMTMMHVASEQGMTGDEAIAKAESMGFECDTPELEAFVKNYVDRHRQR